MVEMMSSSSSRASLQKLQGAPISAVHLHSLEGTAFRTRYLSLSRMGLFSENLGSSFFHSTHYYTMIHLHTDGIPTESKIHISIALESQGAS